MEYLGFLCAILVGLSLGVLGAGGSIITIPVLLYLFKIEPLHATTYSFFIVGCTALIGAIEHVRDKTVQLWPALYFAIPGVISIYCIRQFVLKLIPDVLFSFQNIIITKDIFIVLFFSIVMMAAGISMLFKSQNKEYAEDMVGKKNLLLLIIMGAIVGSVIAFAGVGGGFLITPALTIFARLPIKKAIGTSLCIISSNSFVGFFSSLHMIHEIDWTFLIIFIILTVLGLTFGNFVSKRLDNFKLKRIFGGFVFLVAIFILLNELIFKM